VSVIINIIHKVYGSLPENPNPSACIQFFIVKNKQSNKAKTYICKPTENYITLLLAHA